MPGDPRPPASSPLQFPPELPISARVVDIATAIDAHQVVIVAGATGSGKTTQLPKIALAMGRAGSPPPASPPGSRRSSAARSGPT